MTRVAIILFILLSSTTAQAAELRFLRSLDLHPDIQSADPKQPCTHQLTGQITKGDLRKFQSMKSAGRLDIVCLNSPGGSFAEALLIAKHLKKKHISTKIEAGQTCESACALIFMAGTFYAHESGSYHWRVLHPKGKLGFHAPSLTVPGGNYDAASVGKAYQIALNSIVGTLSNLVRQSGFEGGNSMKVSLLEAMLNTPASSMMYVDTVDKAGRWEITVGPLASDPPAAKLQMANACRNLAAWQKDESALSIQNNIEPDHLYESRKKAQSGSGSIVELQTAAMDPTTCVFQLPSQNTVISKLHEVKVNNERHWLAGKPYTYLPAGTKLSSLETTSSPQPSPSQNQQSSLPNATGRCTIHVNSRLTDNEPCNKTQKTTSTRANLFYVWPSGAKTVLTRGASRTWLNGIRARLRAHPSSPNGICAYVKRQRKLFCYAPGA